MIIQNKELDNKGLFFIETENEKVAELDYSLSPGVLIIDHTEVDDSLRGKNIGYQLVSRVADYAREKNLKIIPVCPFARAVMQKKKDEFSDVYKINK